MFKWFWTIFSLGAPASSNLELLNNVCRKNKEFERITDQTLDVTPDL